MSRRGRWHHLLLVRTALVLLAAAWPPRGLLHPARGEPTTVSLPAAAAGGHAGGAHALAPARHLPRLAGGTRGLLTSLLEAGGAGGDSSSSSSPENRTQPEWMPEVPVHEEPTVETQGGDVPEESLARLFK